MDKLVFDLIGAVISLIQVVAFVISLWIDAVIYVVDSADIDRLNVAKAELAAILKVYSFDRY